MTLRSMTVVKITRKEAVMKISRERRHYIVDRLFTYGLPLLTISYVVLGIYHIVFVPGGRSENGLGVIYILGAMLGFGLTVLHKVMRGDYDRRG